jgi:outer membrane protein assembly complex protein YaeT
MQAMSRFWPTVSFCAAVLLILLLGAHRARTQTPQPKVIVSDIIVQGNRLVPTEEIKVGLKTRVGSEYSPTVFQEDVRTLVATRKFRDVKGTAIDDGPGRVKLYLKIVDYVQVVDKVTYLGAKHLKDDALNELTEIRVGSPLNPNANRTACRKIVAKYYEEGRLYASCQLLKGGDPGDNEVVFQITEGPIVRVRDIRFEGNNFVSGAVLKTHLNTSHAILRCIGGQYNPAMVENDITELEKYYRNYGYHDVKIRRDLEWLPDGQSVIIVFHVQEGLRYKIQDVPDVVGAVCYPREQLIAMTPIRPASYYDQTQVDLGAQRLKDYYGYDGRNTKVEPQTVWSQDTPGVCQVVYQIEERPPDLVGNIIIVGNERTRQNVILRQLPFYPGQLLQYPELRIAENNLRRLNIFANSPGGPGSPPVSPTVTVLNPESESPYKDVLVEVKEDNTGSLIFGVGVNSDAGLTGSIVLNERNFDIFRLPTSFDDFFSGNAFRGAGQELRIEAVPGTQLQRYTISFREPFLFDSPYSLQVGGYYYDRVFNEYTEEREGGRLTIGRKLNQYWSVNVGGRIENINVSNVSIFAPPDYQDVIGDNFLLGGRVGATRDSRDNFLRPTSGSLLDLSVEECTGDKTFTLATIDFSKYFTVWQRRDGTGKHVLAFHSQVGWASDDTPVYERYFAGGFRTLRGFQFRGVSPDINGFKVGGDFLFLNSLEYQIPVKANDSIYFVGFVDSGTVSPTINHIDDYRVSAGFGVRFVVPMLGPVPIALDFGIPIVKGPADNTQLFSFWVGFFR